MYKFGCGRLLCLNVPKSNCFTPYPALYPISYQNHIHAITYPTLPLCIPDPENYSTTLLLLLLLQYYCPNLPMLIPEKGIISGILRLRTLYAYTYIYMYWLINIFRYPTPSSAELSYYIQITRFSYI